jgi:hypothetical protein
VLYVVLGLMLVCLTAGALLLERGRRRPAWWALGLGVLLALNLAVLGLVRLLSSV